MADDTPSNSPRRPDLKTMGLGMGLGAALYALTPLNNYISTMQKPLEVKIDAVKESQVRIENQLPAMKAEIMSAIKESDQRNAENHKGHENRIGNLEFIVLTNKKGK